jgi:hypothetical protein
MSAKRMYKPWDKGVAIGAALAFLPVVAAIVIDRVTMAKEAQREREKAVDQIEEDLRKLTESRRRDEGTKEDQG